jgi:hypothetical protein
MGDTERSTEDIRLKRDTGKSVGGTGR